MPRLDCSVAVAQEVVGHLGRTGHLAGPFKAENEQVKNKTVVLDSEDEGGELTTADERDRGHLCSLDVRIVLFFTGM